MAPPCTSFGHWAHLNNVMHPETWRNSRQIKEILAPFAAHVCHVQLRANRHFTLENPAGSGIFSLACMNDLWDIGTVIRINEPQRALGFEMCGGPISIYIYIQTQHFVQIAFHR